MVLIIRTELEQKVEDYSTFTKRMVFFSGGKNYYFFNLTLAEQNSNASKSRYSGMKNSPAVFSDEHLHLNSEQNYCFVVMIRTDVGSD